MKRIIWIFWVFISAILLSRYGYEMIAASEKESFLIGETTHGHYQIELACNACHTDEFGGTEVLQDACMNCHETELKDAHDSHPKKKFIDPRNADRLEIIDARFCVSCHSEHQNEQTNTMGLTLPNDYCYHCHEDVDTERKSHQNLEFDSCASAGCHNYHDNRALYESFLVENSGGEWLKEHPQLLIANYAALSDIKHHPHHSLSYDEKAKTHPHIVEEWSVSAHAKAGVNCGGCHVGSENQWMDKPPVENCESCHQKETEHFYGGKHGMRLAHGLSPMTPAQARLPFKEGASNEELTCNSCHGSHDYNRVEASYSSCLSCHNDDHSLAFNESPHGHLLGQAINNEIAFDQAVTCATCHLPTMEHPDKKDAFFVEHNQNANLRPNEKMIRPVCMQCHSLDFSIDALADEVLIKNNFNGQPSEHVPSIDWAKENGKK